MFSCLLIALAFAAPWSINTISPMTSATLFSIAFPGDGCFVGELVGTSLADVHLQLSFPHHLPHLCMYICPHILTIPYVHSNIQYVFLKCRFLSIYLQPSMPLAIPNWCWELTKADMWLLRRVAVAKRVCLLQLHVRWLALHSGVHRGAHRMIRLADATNHCRPNNFADPWLWRRAGEREGVDMPLPLLSVCDQAH